MFIRSALATVVLAFTSAAFSQTTKPLAAGSPAPEFRVEKFLKGDEIKPFEKGRVYVVEFWATWCGPCVMSMPHLSQLQREYKVKGVTILGVNVMEEDKYTEKTLGKVVEFVKERGDTMAYTVAFDGASKHMKAKWMDAAEQGGIPTAFVVDGSGVIAWIGHPVQLDMVLDEVVGGTWSISEGPKRLEAAGRAFEEAAARYKDGLVAGDGAWKKAEADYPKMAKVHRVERFTAMMNAKLATEASAMGNSIIDEAVAAKDVQPIMGVVGAFMDPKSRPENFDKALLLKAGRASFDLSPKDHKRHTLMAMVYFIAGDFDAGRAEGAKAVGIADEDIKPSLKNWLDQKEAEFRKPKAAQPK